MAIRIATRSCTWLLLSGAVAGAAIAQAPAASYPTKPVRILVGQGGAGGGADTVARAVAQKLTERLGQSMVVENRPGAGGAIAAAAVTKAPADGYTLLFASGSLIVLPSLYRKLPYDTVRDLAPIGLLGVSPQVLVVHPSVPVKNARELVALAKRRPGQINFGSGGVGTTGHLAAELLKSMTGASITHVAYKGGAPAILAVMAGEIEMMFASAPNAAQHSRTGRIRALGVSSPKRSTALPDVPTIAESGVPGYELMTWYGMLGPVGTPREAVERLNRELAAVVQMPDVISRFAADGVEPAPGTPEQFGNLIKADLARVAKIVREAKIEIE